MIRAVVWKELREQGLIAVMLTVLGAGLLVAAAALADPPAPNAAATDIVGALGAGRLLVLMLVVTAGMVCGGALFAAEREAGTMAFLEALPTARWELWRAKLVAGLVLALAEVSLLLGAAVALDLADGAFVRRLLVYAVLAFAWGALGSTLARTTLGSVGIAIPAATLASFAFLLPIYLIFAAPGTGVPRPIGWALFELLMVAAPLAVSAWRFTAPDRARAADAGAAPGAPASARAGGPGTGVRALVWLTLRQLRLLGPVLSAFAVAFGLALLLPDLRAVFVWPALALSAGVLTGVTAFGDEQAHRSAAFWAEQRLPVGRAWAVKVALHLGLLAWLLVLLALPSAVRAEAEPGTRFGHGTTALGAVFHSRLFDELGAHGWKYLLVPAVYGFAFGHLCGLLFRKLVVACGVAVMLGGVGAALWVPALLAGGVKPWQLWVPAGAVLLTGRLLVRAWAADRAAARGPLLRLAGGTGTAALVLAAGLGYRAVEVPDNPGAADDLALVAALPSYDDNVAGREFRAAAERYARVTAAVNQDPNRAVDPRRRPRIDERLESAVRYGWKNDDPELEDWLNRVWAGPAPGSDDKLWADMAAAAAKHPVGVYEQPQLVSTAAATAAALDNARRMEVALLARGLQHPATFVPNFRTAVALARTVRTGGGAQALTAGIEMERTALYAADRWLERPDVAPDGALELARVAAGADDPVPFDPTPHLLVDRYVIRGLVQAPTQWLTGVLTPSGGAPERAAAEADFVAVAWSVPWERERTRRLIGLAPDGGTRPEIYRLTIGRPGSGVLIRSRLATDAVDAEMQLRVARRAAILKGAIRAYHGTFGKAPEALRDLVTPDLLARLPDDPYSDGRPFGYRRVLTDGEELVGPARAVTVGRPQEDSFRVPLARGWAVLWSVGVDRRDDLGRVPPGGPRAEDIVFTVKLPAPVPR